jgi:hypothetical protein
VMDPGVGGGHRQDPGGPTGDRRVGSNASICRRSQGQPSFAPDRNAVPEVFRDGA